MYKITAVLCLLSLAGCASSSSQYYEAVQKTAEANALAHQAKFDALSKIAASGDGQAASAAVMALALTNTQSIQPIPQQSEALQWASVLAAPVTSLGMMWMQADSAKTMARYNSQVDLARISADASTQEALYGSFVASNATTGEVALGGFNAMGNIDYTPFIDGMVDLGTAGIDGAVTLGTEGFDANTAIATAGFDANTAIATAGIDGAVSLGTVGMNNLTTFGTEAIDGMVTLDSGNNALYSSVWSSYTQSLENMLNAIPEPVTCTVTTAADGSATVTCN